MMIRLSSVDRENSAENDSGDTAATVVRVPAFLINDRRVNCGFCFVDAIIPTCYAAMKLIHQGEGTKRNQSIKRGIIK